jgi:hypothetical protein
MSTKSARECDACTLGNTYGNWPLHLNVPLLLTIFTQSSHAIPCSAPNDIATVIASPHFYHKWSTSTLARSGDRLCLWRDQASVIGRSTSTSAWLGDWLWLLRDWVVDFDFDFGVIGLYSLTLAWLGHWLWLWRAHTIDFDFGVIGPSTSTLA